jgi:hypothetical protein
MARTSPCGICGEQSGTGTGSSRSSSQHYYTSAPHPNTRKKHGDLSMRPIAGTKAIIFKFCTTQNISMVTKIKLSRNKSWRSKGRTECCVSILTLTLSTTRTAKLSAVRAGRTSPQGNSFLFLSLADPGLPTANRRIRSLENFQEPHRELNPGPSV